ncbi:nucleoside recognition protein [Natranaeroarchaeum aerophilus]|uniref:Nucleoside recognition protein n=1 Tax=Natranaeroarchaeum aerophilus TaxID=2917711 RepID=A0AAE3FR42_9EURY|nr:nucleoside recognition protein [Natranaeroarchaeum aerophilus]
MLTIALAIGVGVTLANLAVEFGAVEYIAVLSKPLTSPANLPDEVGTAILTTATSTTAGYGMLAEFRESGLLDDRATLVAVIINTFFGFVQHIFTFYVPVLIPILGVQVGVLYVGARAGIALAITLTGILAGAFLLSDRNVNPTAMDAVEGPESEERTRREKVRSALERTWKLLRKVVPRLAIIYALVVVLIESYDIAEALDFAAPLSGLLDLPPEAIPVIAIYAVDTTAGAVAIAPQLGDPFTPTQAVIAMLVGGVVSFAFSTFKRSIPFQYGIWGAEFGTKVIVVNTVMKIVFISLTVGLLLLV